MGSKFSVIIKSFELKGLGDKMNSKIKEQIKRLKYLEKYKKLMKEGGWEVVHLTKETPKKLKDTIELFKRFFKFEETIFVMRSKTTRRRLYR